MKKLTSKISPLAGLMGLHCLSFLTHRIGLRLIVIFQMRLNPLPSTGFDRLWQARQGRPTSFVVFVSVNPS